jgi:hypothetical protein
LPHSWLVRRPVKMGAERGWGILVRHFRYAARAKCAASRQMTRSGAASRSPEHATGCGAGMPAVPPDGDAINEDVPDPRRKLVR